MAYHPFQHRILRGVAAVAAFLCGFLLLLAGVTRWYLIPALAAAANASPLEKRTLAAHACLMLAVVLFVLLVGLFLSFRVGRSVGRADPRKPTIYSDAWAESARRMPTPPREEE